MHRIVYINTHAAKYGWYFGRRMPRGYRMAAKFWGSGLIDRTCTLYTGFPYVGLYPMPVKPEADSVPDISVLCDASGRRIVEEAINAGKEIEVLWSGGIDSTTALVGILKAATDLDYRDRIEVLLSDESINEYEEFYHRFVKPLRQRHVRPPVTSRINPRRLVVTGEHGDQIFGSAKAAHYVEDGRAFDAYTAALPTILAEALNSPAQADAVVNYIEPLLYVCPIQLTTIFDVFWWLNFSLKWQIVGLRLAVFRITDVRRSFNALRHFFSHSSFQQWSLVNHHRKIGDTWESYKMPLKEYIFDYTGDDSYRRNKVKMPSLRAVLRSDTQRQPPGFRILMDEDFEPVFWPCERVDREAWSTIPEKNRGR